LAYDAKTRPTAFGIGQWLSGECQLKMENNANKNSVLLPNLSVQEHLDSLSTRLIAHCDEQQRENRERRVRTASKNVRHAKSGMGLRLRNAVLCGGNKNLRTASRTVSTWRKRIIGEDKWGKRKKNLETLNELILAGTNEQSKVVQNENLPYCATTAGNK
jgi:hypothetical protein